jgi:GT2 family glycosyltransferase
VVVVTWRGVGLVGRCLDALAAQSAAHELLVVDNASTDGTAAVLAGHRTRPRVLRLAANRGYAGGLAAALPLVGTPYLAWLNDDAEPAPGWLAELQAALDATPRAAAAAALLVRANGTVQSAGVRLTRRGYGADVTEPPPPAPGGGGGVAQAVFGFCGGAALVRTAQLRAAGGVPAGFFCYYEDTDTAWRLRLRGHEVITVPAARVTHRHGASTSIGSPAFHRWNERNRLLTLLRCAPAGVAALELARFAASTAVQPLRRRSTPAAPNHRPVLRLRVLAAVAARLPVTLAQRAAIGRRTRLGRRDVWRTWAGR